VRKFLLLSLLLAVGIAGAAERTVLFEYFTQTG
jgi:hypothetical protein